MEKGIENNGKARYLQPKTDLKTLEIEHYRVIVLLTTIRED